MQACLELRRSLRMKSGIKAEATIAMTATNATILITLVTVSELEGCGDSFITYFNPESAICCAYQGCGSFVGSGVSA
jgi:hypothetical protein